LAGVVDELRIVGDEFIKNGFEFVELDGSEDGDLGDVDRLRGGITHFFNGFNTEDDFVDFSLLSFDSIGILLRGCLVKEDTRRLAAAIGPVDKRSVIELVRLFLEFVGSSLEDNCSLLDILNK
jgi:hypothetical protein